MAVDAAQVGFARRFASGPARSLAPPETLHAIGEESMPAWLVLDGAIDVIRHAGLNTDVAITTDGVGQCRGELNDFAGRPSIAAGHPGSEG